MGHCFTSRPLAHTVEVCLGRTEEWEQEMNVRYVMETRFKKELYLVDMEGYNG
jgi:hypothetical protein